MSPRDTGLWMAACLGALLAGCTVGPDYRRPPLELGAAFPSAPPKTASAIDAGADPAAWWRRLGDARLSETVERAIAANPDLDVAAARVAQSRAALASLRAMALPIGGAGALAGRGSDSAQGPAGQLLQALGTPRQTDLYAGALALTWETDLFGAIRRGREAREAQAQMAVYRLQAARVVVAAEAARAYVVLRGLQQRQDILKVRLSLARRSLTLARRRAAEGEAAVLEVRQAEAGAARLEAALPAVDAGIAQALDSLDVLLGQTLGTSQRLLADPDALPTGMAAQVLEAPAEVVARRPDVAAAERAVAAANAGIGAAVAQYYPSVSLAGLAGLSATQANHLLDADAGLWAGGAVVQWRLLDWGRIGADVALAKGRRAEALAAYRQVAATAAAEIDLALATLQTTAEQARRIEDLTRAVDRARRIAQSAHAVGEATLAPVLDAEDQAYMAQDALVQAKVAAMESTIDLYRALGGA